MGFWDLNAGHFQAQCFDSRKDFITDHCGLFDQKIEVVKVMIIVIEMSPDHRTCRHNDFQDHFIADIMRMGQKP